MPKRKGRLPADQHSGDFAYRVGKTIDSDKPAKDVLRLVLASEFPVRVFDYEEWDVVDEVLRMDGLQFNAQVPLLNSHDRGEARSVIGSIRDLEVSGDRLEGSAYFATTEEAQQIRKLYDEGHLTDFSIGFQPEEVMRVKRGETTTIGGRKYTGPIRIVTKARAKEGSAVAIGADEHAKALREYPALRAYFSPDSLREELEMDKLRNFCLTRGMPADTPDDEIPKWMEDNLRSAAEDPEEETTTVPPATDPPGKENAERTRAAAITASCAASGISMQQCASYIRSDLTVDQVNTDILRKKNRERTADQNRSLGGGNNGDHISALESEDEKFHEGALGALVNRCLMGIDIEKAEKHAAGKYQNGGKEYSTFHRDQSAMEGVAEVKRLVTTPVARDLRNVGLYELARTFVQRDAYNRRGFTGRDVTFGLSRTDVVKQALSLDMKYRDDAAYHTTGSFSNILLDAARKTLLMAYEEAAVTYPIWTRQAPSAVDFKTINRIRLGELPDPVIVPENAKYGETTTGDSKESYVVEKYGYIFSISLEAIVNDDLNAISRIPANQGAAMRRKINKVVYAVLTANAALSDGVAIFHASSHGANLDATALSIAALNVGWTIMAVQAGLTSGVILNLQPRFLLVPPALGYTALQLVGSLADPSNTAGSTEDASRPNFNSGTLNVYGPQGSRPLTPVIDAAISTSESATAWYLAAEPNQVDTVEVCFLQGEETPYLEREDGFEVDAVRYKIRQTFGAKAIDYRGLYQGNS